LQIEKNDFINEDQLDDLHITNLNIERLNAIYATEGEWKQGQVKIFFINFYI
jgi:hypothetical protein